MFQLMFQFSVKQGWVDNKGNERYNVHSLTLDRYMLKTSENGLECGGTELT